MFGVDRKSGIQAMGVPKGVQICGERLSFSPQSLKTASWQNCSKGTHGSMRVSRKEVREE